MADRECEDEYMRTACPNFSLAELIVVNLKIPTLLAGFKSIICLNNRLKKFA